MNIKEILIAARAKIERPENWTKGAFSRDSQGHEVSPIAKTSVCWCTIGAIAATDVDYDDERLAIRYLIRVTDLYGNSISRFNDTSTHAEVLAVFDRAIAIAGEAT